MKKKDKKNIYFALFTLLINSSLPAFSAPEKWEQVDPDPYVLNITKSLFDPISSSLLAAAFILLLWLLISRMKKAKKSEEESEDEPIDMIMDESDDKAEEVEDESKGRVMIQPLFDDSKEIKEMAIKKLENIYNIVKENNLTLNKDGFLEEPIDDNVVNEIFKIALTELENAKNEMPSDSEFSQTVKDGIAAASDYPESIPGTNAVIGTLKALGK
jgi:hypothetical protein